MDLRPAFKNLVHPYDLYERLGDASTKIVDATWFLDPAISGREVYLEQHIPGAVHFDIDDICAKNTSLPHMLPTPVEFETAAGALGISQEDHIFVYDASGVFSAARVWWTFNVMGARNVYVLNGGLPKWKLAGFPVTSDPTRSETTMFRSKFVSGAIQSLGSMLSIVDDQTHQILDARPADRFLGRVPEPRQGLLSGHMPHSINTPISDIIRDGELLSPGQLRQYFEDKSVSRTVPIVTSCGSGVTAALIYLALQEAGYDNLSLYDGSWAEWGAKPDHPCV